KATGGTEYGFHSQRTLEDAVQKLGDLLHSEYMISYSPNNRNESGFHEIKVDIPRRSDVKRVQTRPGYWLRPKGELLLTLHLQVVGNAEGSGDTIRPDAGHVLVALIGNHSL